jgi:hypothetical protein
VSNLQRSEIILIAAVLGPMRGERHPVVAACGLLEMLTLGLVATPEFACCDQCAPHGQELNQPLSFYLAASLIAFVAAYGICGLAEA